MVGSEFTTAEGGVHDAVAGIGCGCRQGPAQARLVPFTTGNSLPCRSNTMPNTVIIFRDPGIGSRTGRSTTQHCGGAAA